MANKLGLSVKERNQIIKRFQRYGSKIISEADEKLALMQYNKAKKICKSAVDSYYNDYDPMKHGKYRRKYSLYEAYHVGIRGKKFVFELGDELMTSRHRVSNEYIYEMMFQEGWHGGANKIAEDKIDRWLPHPDPGVPYWRYPGKPRGNMERWERWNRFPAPRSKKSPYNTIKDEWIEYINSEKCEKEQIDIFVPIFKEYLLKKR